MKIIRQAVNSRIYHIIANIVTILSIVFIFIDKFIDLDILTYQILFQADLAISILFALDFLLRFAAGGKAYFIKDFGWVDFLAALPVLTPAIKGMAIFRMGRAARALRALRILRLIRVLKFLKLDSSRNSQEKQQFQMTLASVLMILLIAGSIMIVIDRDNRLNANDYEAEISLIRLAKMQPTDEAAKALLGRQPRVLAILNLETLSKEHKFSGSLFRADDTRVQSMGGYYIVFSRKHSRRSMELFEGWLMLGVFGVTVAMYFLASRQFDKLFLRDNSGNA